MRFGDFDEYHPDYDDGPDAPDGYIPETDAFEYVFENERDAVEERVRADAAEEWLKSGQPWLDLLNIVSRHDKEQLRRAIRQDTNGSRKAALDEIEEPQLFAVASDSARHLESIGSVHAKFCTSSEDFTWVKNLIKLTRAFREILFLTSEPEDSWMVEHHLAAPLMEINSALTQGRPAELQLQRIDAKTQGFQRSVNPSMTPLCSYLAEWMCEFIVCHSRRVGLSVCTECGTIFVRGRRDNVYCSKACQNRVAYKRKKIFESGVLVEEKINANSPSAIVPGLWINHTRLGLGRIETATFSDRRLWLQFKGHGYGERIPDGSSAEEHLSRLKKDLKDKLVSWEEVIDPRSLELRVRFLQLARSFRAWEVFPNARKLTNAPTFYRVTDTATLADLL
jgi:hypothetical protein